MRRGDEVIAGEDSGERDLELDRESIIPAIVDGIIGLSAGDSRSFDVTLPQDYPREEMRGHGGQERGFRLGHSHGGVVAQAYAARYPSRVRKLVLASTLARFASAQEKAMHLGMEKRSNQPWYQDALAALEAEQAGNFTNDDEMSELVFREMPLYFAHYGPVEAGYLDTLRTERLNADTLRLFNKEIFTTFDLRSRLPNITTETLVITGDEDFICGPLCAEEICSGIPGARMVIVGDSGHMIFVEQPQKFHDEIADFLGS